MFPAGNIVLGALRLASFFSVTPSAVGLAGIKVHDEIKRHNRELHSFFYAKDRKDAGIHTPD